MSAAEKSVFITGASRGIGAAAASEFADRHYSVGIGFRDKIDRAKRVLDIVDEKSPDTMNTLFVGDITNPPHNPYSRDQIINEVKEWMPQLGGLILNAAGGLEKGKEADYGLAINSDAQVELTRGLAEALSPEGTVVFLTSHWAHLHGQAEMPPFDYEPVASSKRAGEDRLRAMIPELSEREIRLIVVSGGIVTGTFVGGIAQRRFPAFFESQKDINNVVSVEDMATAIADAVEDPDLPSGHTVVVGASFEELIH